MGVGTAPNIHSLTDINLPNSLLLPLLLSLLFLCLLPRPFSASSLFSIFVVILLITQLFFSYHVLLITFILSFCILSRDLSTFSLYSLSFSSYPSSIFPSVLLYLFILDFFFTLCFPSSASFNLSLPLHFDSSLPFTLHLPLFPFPSFRSLPFPVQPAGQLVYKGRLMEERFVV